MSHTPANKNVPAGGTTGQVLSKASNADYDTEWDADDTGGGGSLTRAMTRVTSGDLSLTNTTYAEMTTSLRTAIDAVEGDWVQLACSYLILEPAGQVSRGEIATIVSGAITNYCSGAGSGGNGVQSLFSNTLTNDGKCACIQYQVQAGDIVAGQVTFNIIAKGSLGGTRTIAASATNPLELSVVNLGQ